MSKRKRDEKSAKSSVKGNTGTAEPSLKQQKLNDGARSPVSTSKNKTINGKSVGSGLGKAADRISKTASPATASHPKSQPTQGNAENSSSQEHISTTLQIITGSYERALHGITAQILLPSSSSSSPPVSYSASFSDTFLFNAHSSTIRSLALSPPDLDTQSLYLATGSSDERINIYSLSLQPMPTHDSRGRKIPSLPSLGNNTINENPLNRELGTLVQHSATITSLHFPSRSKLLAASEDNTISITRLRDLEVVSSIKAPRPKISGQASGDTSTATTAAAGGTVIGINDFAVHPSQKLMLTLGRSDRSMRLWNLVTGKKAGVLNFERSVLQAVHESKYSHGEGRKIRWNPAGTQFAVAFEYGVVLFGGADVKVKCIAVPEPRTKIHEIAYLNLKDDLDGDAKESGIEDLLAVSTESGRVLLFNTATTSTSGATQSGEKTVTNEKSAAAAYTYAPLHAEIHTPTSDSSKSASSSSDSSKSSSTRIKTFKFLPFSTHTQTNTPNSNSNSNHNGNSAQYNHPFEGYCLITATSTGQITLLAISRAELLGPPTNTKPDTTLTMSKSKIDTATIATTDNSNSNADSESNDTEPKTVGKIGTLINSYPTGARITCLEAFVMSPPSPDEAAEFSMSEHESEAESGSDGSE